MALIIKSAFKLYSFLLEEIKDPRSDNYPLVGGSPVPIILLVISYAALCKYGPVLMKSRKPFKLTLIMTIYNLIQVVACTISVTLGIYYVLWKHPYNFRCEPVDYSYSEKGIIVSKFTYLYFLFKVLDLLDTVFIILKKNDSQLSFLHCYHHGAMVLAIYSSTKWLPGGHGCMLGLVNTFVHSIMYFYYFLTAFKPELKKSIWWKKHITQLQLAQFAYLAVHFFQVIFRKNCSFPTTVAVLVGTQNLFFFMLFGDFYYKAYVKVKKTQ